MNLPALRREDKKDAGFTGPNVEVRFSKVLFILLMALEGSKSVNLGVPHVSLKQLSRLRVLLS